MGKWPSAREAASLPGGLPVCAPASDLFGGARSTIDCTPLESGVFPRDAQASGTHRVVVLRPLVATAQAQRAAHHMQNAGLANGGCSCQTSVQ